MKLKKNGKTTSRKFRSLKSKILTTLFIACALILTITGITIVKMVNDSFTANQKNLIFETSQSVSNKAEIFFDHYITIVEQMSRDKNIQNFFLNAKPGDDITEIENFMSVAKTVDDTQKSDPDVILSAYIAEAEPSYYIISPTVHDQTGYDITKAEYYKSITDGIVTITEPFVDVYTGNMIIAITAPTIVDGKNVGLTAVDIELEKLTKIISEYELGKTGYFMLVSDNNIVVAHKDEDNITKSIKDINISENLINNINTKNNETIEYAYNGEKFVGNINLIGDTDWKIISAMPINEFSSSVRQITTTILIVYLLSIILLLSVMYVIIVKTTNPIKDITEITNELAKGQLDVSINVKSNDEIGKLAISIESLTSRLKSYITYINESVDVLDELANGNLLIEFKHDYNGEFVKLKSAMINVSDTFKKTIGKIQESSESINMNAEHVSLGAQTLAQGTTEQASAIEELSAEINEIYATIVNNAKHAENAGKKAMEASKEVEMGNVHMRDMLIAIDEISNSSSEIGKIIKVIDDIAFQTNILSLNAAVEAARAGSAGKGFAVVADEVRNLAQKSAEAAKQTNTLIEKSINAINKGTILADEAGKSIGGIVSKTNETNILINEIVSASSQQTVSVNQIKSGIEQISSVVQENASTAESSAANSEELSKQSQVLNDLVNKFKLDYSK